RARAVPLEVEAGSRLLLHRHVDERIGARVEQPRLPERADDAVLGHAGGRRVLRVEAETREQVDRPVAAEQVTPADLEKDARREIELVGGRTAGRRARDEPAL